MRRMLARLRAGELSVDEALEEIRRTQLVELAGHARLDLGRSARRGIPEVVLAAGKAPAEAAGLILALAREQGQGLGSRLSPDHWAELEGRVGELTLLRYGPTSALVRSPRWEAEPTGGRAGIVTAGTSDLGAAEEARMVMEAAGVEVKTVFDVGVAGLHRLLEPLGELVGWRADVLVVAAGMDGVLPGVVAGLVDAPVIGLPIATGYGAGGEGEAALLTMLQSCSTGLTVVNIGNGIGAGTAAALIARRAAAARRPPPPPARARRGARSGPGGRARAGS
ncbi:MAG TPA: nickel pincer cofactor biosynthesis protein LarB [Candidatus Dormibacteraeota bacterium]|nr:nickel pincer cofactor biosynthesis protein LarB [Candidatus Dormibacteraeota bacterium]